MDEGACGIVPALRSPFLQIFFANFRACLQQQNLLNFATAIIPPFPHKQSWQREFRQRFFEFFPSFFSICTYGHQMSASPPENTPPDAVATPSSSASPSPPQPTKAADPFSFLYDLPRIPCFRNAMLWGIGTGTVFGLHALYRFRHLGRAALTKAGDYAVGGFGVVALGQYFWCRQQFKRRREELRVIMDANSPNPSAPPTPPLFSTVVTRPSTSSSDTVRSTETPKSPSSSSSAS